VLTSGDAVSSGGDDVLSLQGAHLRATLDAAGADLFALVEAFPAFGGFGWRWGGAQTSQNFFADFGG
jgi:hypothetical protein